MVDRFDPCRDITIEFLNLAEAWINSSGECLVVARYMRAAGSKDYALCNDYGQFMCIVNRVSIGTEIEICRDRQLPLRGILTQ
jgi:hypothetical protein